MLPARLSVPDVLGRVGLTGSLGLVLVARPVSDVSGMMVLWGGLGRLHAVPLDTHESESVEMPTALMLPLVVLLVPLMLCAA
eukprot:8097105-Pyramimonas_sp.AAC.1